MRPGPPSPRRARRPAVEGSVEVFVADEQDDHPVELARWCQLATDVLRAEGVRGGAELSLLFVSAEAMADLNRRFTGTDGPTDVLAFPLEEDLVEVGRWPDASSSGPDRSSNAPDDAPVMLGDVVICPAVAAPNAADHAGSYADEVALLVVHGVLHVLGLDHGEPEATAAMQARERYLLDRFYGPLAGDPWSVEPP